MTSPDRDLPVSEGPRPAVAHTTTNLKRWSVGNNRDLPAVNQIRAIHVYDFDNTLFQSPLPNPQVWNGLTIGFLQSYDGFAAGGWWHDPNLLTATGEGAEIEEKRAWEGWWNEQVVQLVQLSMQQKDALTVLLTGRSEAGFADIIKRIVASRKLEFDLICLKPEVGPNNEHFPSTIHFKEAFLRELMLTYCHADEIRVYEDRVKHVKAFREFFENANLEYLSAGSPRKPIKSEVVHVVEKTKYLDPVVEVAEVQKMINSHNSRYHDPALNVTKSPYGRLQIKRQVFFTGYLLSHADSTRLISTLLPTSVTDTTDLKYMANNVMISPRPATQAVLDKVGGMGKKLRWRVTGIAVYDRSVWAARVQPVDETEQICTVDTTPIIVLAVRKGARPIDASRIQTWQPVSESQAIEFDSVVGEKVLLRIEEESPGEGGGWSGRLTNNHRTQKRRFHPDTPGEDLVNPARDSRDHQANNHHPQNSARAPSPNDQGRYFRNSNNNDHSPRRGGGGSGGRGDGHSGGGRGRGSGPRRGRGGPPSGGSFRGRGRGGGGGRGYRFLDDHAGMEAGYDERPNGMNY